MDFQTYTAKFKDIINDPEPPSPYDNPDYLEYAKLNWSRMNRWLKKAELSGQLSDAVKRIAQPQLWLVITEPWCGDAAHSVPFIELAARLNPLITVDYELRDAPPFRINTYLTDGSRSIPKLIIRNEAGQDLAVWGPRPLECQRLFNQLKAEEADFDTQKIALQKWYNEDKGRSIQTELALLLLFF